MRQAEPQLQVLLLQVLEVVVVLVVLTPQIHLRLERLAVLLPESLPLVPVEPLL
jgi:hypothetical protein